MVLKSVSIAIDKHFKWRDHGVIIIPQLIPARNGRMSTEERVAALEARIESLATKEDIVRLETRMDAWEDYMATKKDIAELKGFIQESISQSEIKTLKQFVAFWVVIAGLSIPILSGIFSFVFNTLTLR